MSRPAADSTAQHLRVLIANERHDRLELLAGVVTRLGSDPDVILDTIEAVGRSDGSRS